MKFVNTINGRVAYVSSKKTGRRYFLKQTSLKSWVLSKSPNLTLDSMVEVGGQFHFRTQEEVSAAFEKSIL